MLGIFEFLHIIMNASNILRSFLWKYIDGRCAHYIRKTMACNVFKIYLNPKSLTTGNGTSKFMTTKPGFTIRRESHML